MSRFFIKQEQIKDDFINICKDDSLHIAKVLRLKINDTILLCDGEGYDYICQIENIYKDVVKAKIIEKAKNTNESDVKITLYQAMPKGDKMDFIIQKSIELGVNVIVPINTIRCVSRPDDKSKIKKIERYNKIANEAAKQCGRGIMPIVENYMEFDKALEHSQKNDVNILFYENADSSIKGAINKLDLDNIKSIGVIVGSEGGFEEKEIEKSLLCNISVCSLGKLILRCETAGIVGISIIKHILGEIE